MDSLFSVVLLAVALSALCLSFSTWTTVADLQQLVKDDAASAALASGSHRWQDLASRTVDHIEHRTGRQQEPIRLASAATGEQSTTSQQEEESLDAVISLSQGKCYILPHTDYFGEAVAWGPHNKQDTAEACCKTCLNFRPASAQDAGCNVWVWCGDKERCGDNFRHCWLKHLPWIYSSKPKRGPEVPWTSGLLEPPQDVVSHRTDDLGGPERAYHTVTTAQGKGTQWQMRVHYYWFKKQQKECRRQYGTKCHMGGFTRLLHSGSDDELSAEIPTYVVNPLPAGSNHGYVVLNRPYAFLQWVQQVTIAEKYVLMSEPDHVFLRPLQNIMRGDRPAAFPFFYIEPSRKDYVHITQKFIGADKTRRDAEQIAPIGSSPTFLRFDDLGTVAGPWVNNSIAIFQDPESNKEWGWVMEMYAFTISLYNAGVGPVALHLELASQPPWDTAMHLDGVPYYILHYTYGMDYTLDGVFTPGKFGAWRFDKRSYINRPPPRDLPLPPSGMQNDLVRFLINAINEASDAIPGWDQYADTSVAQEFMKYDI